MILMIDNYDSFTYNLVQYVGELGEELQVYRNDKITIEEIERLAPDYLMISPGPCTPNEAGISMDVIRHFAGKIPILGVCLGHQSIGQVFGGKVVRAQRLMHGKTSDVFHDGQTIFRDIPSPYTAARYHSLLIEEGSLPDELEVTARTADGEIMAIRHRDYPIEGVQFHPESIITQHGKQLLKNFLTTYARDTAVQG
ncbi:MULTISPECIES: aminodeoxychorismate/anthranilate synthase component II [Brevibacillus]|uniref:Aminodeoxychorismate/anthranilate synthase component II n=1 Tax=Brevibacillus invocatus TaxID=173959 RepID=A0A3M8BZ99_9BACL|nr:MULTISPECIES: aminodeoxychorismate/anthranilate synthase component II [Brevibacillus]MDH4619718.1 aminodeoxychorismate/anthranilate synthase component II [Brevibacillus sp. AY1]RNB68780.1 aminodeoxychorismate/anthranilate synthase component II [Brevibacillus invocatus]